MKGRFEGLVIPGLGMVKWSDEVGCHVGLYIWRGFVQVMLMLPNRVISIIDRFSRKPKVLMLSARRCSCPANTFCLKTVGAIE